VNLHGYWVLVRAWSDLEGLGGESRAGGYPPDVAGNRGLVAGWICWGYLCQDRGIVISEGWVLGRYSIEANY
jgi:hypothetical protein